MKSVCTYFLLFLIYAVLGWIMEVICKLIEDHKFINRGFLIGPYCPIYGWGSLGMTFLLNRYLDDPITLFIMAILLCSILEYATSYFLEKIFKTRWWDYSNYRFHINGRICLETMIPFGLLGLLIMYVLNPFFLSILEKIPMIFLLILTIILLMLFMIDVVVSYRIMSSLKNISSEIRTDSTEKITALVKKEILKRNKLLQKRLVQAFPKLEILYSKGIERRKTREQRKKKKNI